jgi:hypothetical protein
VTEPTPTLDPVEQIAAQGDDWTRDPDTLERIFHAALSAGDAEGVDAALRLLLACDAPRAIRLFDDLRAALAVVHVLSGAQ